jgi:hypothetical protein
VGNGTTGTLTFDVQDNQNGSSEITVTVIDSEGAGTSETFMLTVNAVNDAPVLEALEDEITQSGVAISVILSATDVDGDALIFNAESYTDGVAAEIAGDVLTLVPGEFYSGTAVISVVAYDGVANSNSESFSLTVIAYDHVSLAGGWNLMSYDIFMDVSTPEDVFADLIEDENLVVVTGYDGSGFLFYEPTGIPGLNTLETIEPGDGYFVKLHEDASILQSGNFIPGDYAVDLPQGWSILAYWLHQAMAPEEAFVELMGAGSLIYVTHLSLKLGWCSLMPADFPSSIP